MFPHFLPALSPHSTSSYIFNNLLHFANEITSSKAFFAQNGFSYS